METDMDRLSVMMGGLHTCPDNSLRPQIAPPEPRKPTHQCFHSFLCLDVESTCIDVDAPDLVNPQGLSRDKLQWHYPNEIIEWPVILLQWRLNDGCWELYEADRYRRLVKPQWRSKISKYCTDLTGITQDDVDQASSFSVVLKDFDLQFVKRHKLFTTVNRTVWVTDGPWDFRDHFPKSLFLSRIDPNNLPKYLKSPLAVIDIRYLLKVFVPRICNFALPHSLSLTDAMTVFGLEFEGRQHSGIDDAANVARLLCRMVAFSIIPGQDDLRWTFRPNRFLELRGQRYFWMSKNDQCAWTLP